MSTVDIDNIYTAIYGNAATQKVDLIGGVIEKYKRPTTFTARVMDKVMSGGAKRSKAAKNNIKLKSAPSSSPSSPTYKAPYDYITYELSDAKKWIDTTRLSEVCIDPQRDAIIVIPPKSLRDEQISAIESTLAKEGLKGGTSAANSYIVSHSFPHKDYCLNVYGKNPPDNKGFQYKVPESLSSTNPIRRTARSSNVFYILFGGANKILVSATSDMTNAKNLKHLCRCENGVHVLEGTLPSPTETTPRESTVIEGGGKGGAKNNRKYFERLINYRGGDISAAAYDFLGALKIAGVPASTIAKRYSSNYTNSAFENMFAMEGGAMKDYPILQSIYENSDIDDAHKQIQKAYKTRKSVISIPKAKALLDKIYNETNTESSSGADANNKFFTRLEKAYDANSGGISSLNADIATCVTRARSGVDAFRDACAMVDALEECKNDNSSVFNVESISGGSRTPLIHSVYSLLKATPFIGSTCKESIPLPVSFKYTTTTRISGGGIYDLNDEEFGGSDNSTDSDDNEEDDAVLEEKCEKCGKPLSDCTCNTKSKSASEEEPSIVSAKEEHDEDAEYVAKLTNEFA